ncbi:MAG: MutS N-terminal domain-containing protein [Planctomycetota bacterium]|jgi:hypothetical protein
MAKTDEKLTPAMKQFHHFKQKYPDAVLFFHMGRSNAKSNKGHANVPSIF